MGKEWVKSFHKAKALTASQNSWGVGGNLWRPPGPTPLLKQSHLEQAAQDCVQVVLKSSKEWDSTASWGKLFHSSVYPHSKSVSLYSEGTTCVFSLCPLPLVLSLSTAEKDLAPFSWHPPFRYLTTLIRSSPIQGSTHPFDELCEVSVILFLVCQECWTTAESWYWCTSHSVLTPGIHQ